MLYWWGYTNGSLQDCISANGWSFANVSAVAPTHNTRDISLAESSSQGCGVGSSNKITFTKAHFIANPTSFGGGGCYVYTLSAKNIDGNYVTDSTSFDTTGIAHKELSTATTNYICINTIRGAAANVYAVWYE